jgi:hypothetical protein
MAILFRGNKANPPWLAQARDFCRAHGITVMGSGPNMLTVEAKTSERAAQIASRLASLGFKPVPNEDDAYTGMLDLSPDPDAIHTHLASLPSIFRAGLYRSESFRCFGRFAGFCCCMVPPKTTMKAENG